MTFKRLMRKSWKVSPSKGTMGYVVMDDPSHVNFCSNRVPEVNSRSSEGNAMEWKSVHTDLCVENKSSSAPLTQLVHDPCCDKWSRCWPHSHQLKTSRLGCCCNPDGIIGRPCHNAQARLFDSWWECGQHLDHLSQHGSCTNWVKGADEDLFSTQRSVMHLFPLHRISLWWPTIFTSGTLFCQEIDMTGVIHSPHNPWFFWWWYLPGLFSSASWRSWNPTQLNAVCLSWIIVKIQSMLKVFAECVLNSETFFIPLTNFLTWLLRGVKLIYFATIFTRFKPHWRVWFEDMVWGFVQLWRARMNQQSLIFYLRYCQLSPKHMWRLVCPCKLLVVPSSVKPQCSHFFVTLSQIVHKAACSYLSKED